MELFYQNAFWGFLILAGALVSVIYKLFNSNIEKIEKRIEKIEEEIKNLNKI